MAVKADLASAREALEHGRSKWALQLAWKGAITSITSNDRRAIEEAIEVAEAIRDRSTGRTREDAAQLAAYAAYARDNPKAPHLLGIELRSSGSRT